jgi:hypothetical protein
MLVAMAAFLLGCESEPELPRLARPPTIWISATNRHLSSPELRFDLELGPSWNCIETDWLKPEVRFECKYTFEQRGRQANCDGWMGPMKNGVPPPLIDEVLASHRSKGWNVKTMSGPPRIGAASAKTVRMVITPAEGENQAAGEIRVAKLGRNFLIVNCSMAHYARAVTTEWYPPNDTERIPVGHEAVAEFFNAIKLPAK